MCWSSRLLHGWCHYIRVHMAHLIPTFQHTCIWSVFLSFFHSFDAPSQGSSIQAIPDAAFFYKTCLSNLSRLALNLWPSCLSLWVARIAGLCHHALLMSFFFLKKSIILLQTVLFSKAPCSAGSFWQHVHHSSYIFYLFLLNPWVILSESGFITLLPSLVWFKIPPLSVHDTTACFSFSLPFWFIIGTSWQLSL